MNRLILSLLLVGLACVTPIGTGALRASETSASIVVILTPGESKEVSISWDEVPITRLAYLWVTTKSTIKGREDLDHTKESTSNKVTVSIDSEKTKTAESLLTDLKQKLGTILVPAVLKVTADRDAPEGITRFYSRWGGGQGAVDLRSCEIKVVVRKKSKE